MGAFDQHDGEPLFMAMSDDNEALVLSVEEARTTLCHFKAAFSKPKFSSAYFLMKARFEDSSEAAHFAHIWLQVNDILEDLLFCSTFEVPENFGGLESNQSYVLEEDRVEDWMINDNGRLYGGFSVRLQRKALPDADKSEFDRYTGVSEYVEEMP